MANTLRRCILPVLGEVLFQGGPGPAFLCNLQGSFTECLVIAETAFGWRALPQYRRAVLGDLDQFGRDDCIQPYEVPEQFCNLISAGDGIRHTKKIVPLPDEIHP